MLSVTILKRGNRLCPIMRQGLRGKAQASTGEIGDHRIEHEEALRRHPQAAVALLEKPERRKVREALRRRAHGLRARRSDRAQSPPRGEAPSGGTRLPRRAARDVALHHAMPLRQPPAQPGLGALLGRERQPAARRDEPPMRARAHARIFAIAPIGEVVAAFRARPGMVRHLVGRKPVPGATSCVTSKRARASSGFGGSSFPARHKASKGVPGSSVS